MGNFYRFNKYKLAKKKPKATLRHSIVVWGVHTVKILNFYQVKSSEAAVNKKKNVLNPCIKHEDKSYKPFMKYKCLGSQSIQPSSVPPAAE